MLAVQESGVPAPVRRFIAGHIESVGQLEVLLLLRAAADKQWTTDEVALAHLPAGRSNGHRPGVQARDATRSR